MKYFRLGLVAVATLGIVGNALAAASAEEVGQLGATLTAVGAEKAGNKDGSIPEFTNIPIVPPADFKAGSGVYPDPFKAEKPLFSIDARNMDKYADRLSEGTKALLQRWPTYRIDVYPTHRTSTYSKWIADNTIRNATSAKLVADGIGVDGAYGGPPFPIPKSGAEVVWNNFLQPKPVAIDTQKALYAVDSTGRRSRASVSTMYHEFSYYDRERTSLEGPPYYKFVTTTVEPARDAGNKNLAWYSINYAKQDFLVWQYSTGQRRVRLAPETKYDSLAGPGGYTFDENMIYTGPPDRYDFQLVGKKEMYVPYNTYRAAFGVPDSVFGPQHINPDALRWELHRVWIVEATLKSGKSHAYPKRTFYADEDSWAFVLADSYDGSGKLSRVAQGMSFNMYDDGTSGLFNVGAVYYNLVKGGYTMFDYYGEPNLFVVPVAKRPPSDTTSDAMGGGGIR